MQLESTFVLQRRKCFKMLNLVEHRKENNLFSLWKAWQQSYEQGGDVHQATQGQDGILGVGSI